MGSIRFFSFFSINLIEGKLSVRILERKKGASYAGIVRKYLLYIFIILFKFFFFFEVFFPMEADTRRGSRKVWG